MKYYVGTSGWTYKHWNKRFFPEGLPQAEWLRFLSSKFRTVEVNTTFYHMARWSTFEKWRAEVRRGFRFTIKMYRLFTHIRRLRLKKEDEETLAAFLEGASILEDKLGPFLIQLPPSFPADIKRLDAFVALIRKREKKLKAAFKLAVEVRHKSWFNEDTYDFFRDRNIGFVITNSPGWPSKVIRTADFVYMRFHGRTKLFASNYTGKELAEWTHKLRDLGAKETYCYFNNDANAYAADNALTLREMLEGKPGRLGPAGFSVIQ